MRENFSWEKSAEEYIKMYKSIPGLSKEETLIDKKPELAK
jgi:glycogen synthase